MTYTVLSPWAKSGYLEKKPINPRPNNLKGKTVGFFSSFKEYHPFFMRELEKQLAVVLPYDTRYSHFTYTVDTSEIQNDPVHYPEFRNWLQSVDVVVGVGADMGSCALFMGYIFAHIEKLGKPSVLLAKNQYSMSASKGAASRAYPGLRIVSYDGPSFVPNGVDCEEWTIKTYRKTISDFLPQIIGAMTTPLTSAEQHPASVKDMSSVVLTGTLDEINDIFYHNGWTNGTPVVPPTEEAVIKMLKGTELPRDHIVAELPPMMGAATTEKIAINGIMAGCLPTYMPVLIAMVEAMADDRIKLEGWTCSNAGWAPTIVINGPIRKVLGINSGRNLLSPYTKPSSCIARALAYMIMNISGCRSQKEDMSGPGSDCRFGICVAENEEESPWPPLQTDYGFNKNDSCVTLFWPSEHTQLPTVSVSATLGKLCSLWHGGFDVGAAVILPPESAKLFVEAGYSKADILAYMKEYNRRPSAEIPRAAIGNNHPRLGLVFPAPGLEHSAPLFWNTEHMFVIVGGCDWGMAYLGGGDHGGPVCKKVRLPSDWNHLTNKYSYFKPEYLDY